MRRRKAGSSNSGWGSREGTSPGATRGSPPPGFSLQHTALLFLRALRLRCPRCGGGPIFSAWFRMRSRCPTCGLRLERGEQGYIVGAMIFNIAVAEFLFITLLLGVMAVTWPSPPWDLIQYAGGALMILAPIAFYPFSKTLFLALDLSVSPRRPEDFDPE